MTQIDLTNWYLERVLFALAGTVSTIGLCVGFFISPWGFLFNGMVSFNLLLFASVHFCPASYVLNKLGVPYKCELQKD
ncbi:DUF2892 domain-containing protein [Leptospira semungkisensis]|uniref:DUF2892 domain-containing protein n=1 Tax=Leptospira semungkisensis TaxID=2484985 RepID=A0A4R9G6W0_9LEPT|nr:DUF2892 domain-containing protein [Leptospira semungkisensis]